MTEHEQLGDTKTESLNDKNIALTVLGHNISPGSRGRIRSASDHLSFFTKLNVEAAGILCRKGLTNTVIFSTGQTAGNDMPSEAYAMEEYWLKKFPDLAHVNRYLERESVSTGGNAEKSIAIAKKAGFRKIALLTTRSHIPSAAIHFDIHGHKIEKHHLFASELVYADFLKSEGVSDRKINRFLNDCKDLDLLDGSYPLELGKRLLLNTVDPKGKLPDLVTKLTRG